MDESIEKSLLATRNFFGNSIELLWSTYCYPEIVR